MKKIFKLLLALVLAVTLTGCVKYHVNMGVGEDKSVTLEIIYGMEMSLEDESWEDDEYFDDESYWDEDTSWEDDEYFDDESYWDEDTSWEDDEYFDDESYWDEDTSWEDDEYFDEDYYEDESDTSVDVEDYSFLEGKGFKVEEFEEQTDEGVIAGVKITKTYPNIDDITKDKKIIVDFNKMFGEETADSFDDSQYFYKKGNKYVANFVFDFSEEGDDTDYSAYQDMFDLEYKIKLPKKSGSNNATKVSADGKELTWDLKYGEKNEVNFEFSFENTNTILIIVLTIGGIAIVGIIATVVVMTSKKKKNTPQGPTNNMQYQNPNNQNFN